MPLTAGTRLGSYEVVALPGASGMGEVYRARDTKLGRDVAIKILPELFAPVGTTIQLTEPHTVVVPRLADISINLPVAVFACGIVFALWREPCADRTP